MRSALILVLLSGCGGRVREDGSAAPTPAVEVESAIAVGSNHGCVLRRDGRVYCFGDNNLGQIGVPGCAEDCPATLVAAVSPARAIAASGDTTCAVLDDGKVACFGDAFRFSAASCGGEFRCDRTPHVLEGFARARTITVGSGWVCTTTEDGRVQCAGDNPFEQVFPGGAEQEHVAREIPGLTGAVEVSAGHLHTCARTNTGDVRCWGNNDYGQLGGAPTERDVTRRLGARSLVATPTMTCFTDEAAFRCVGRAEHGADTSFVLGELPRAAASNAALYTSVYLVRSDGTVFAPPSHPLPGFHNVRRIAASYGNACALTDAGAVHCATSTGVRLIAVPP